MSERNPIFNEYYQNYLASLTSVDVAGISDRLGLLPEPDGRFQLSLFTDKFLISAQEGISNIDGRPPSYPQLVILARYLLNCPDADYEDHSWVAFKDFKLVSHFTNVNFFNSDTEAVIVKAFAGQIDRLKQVGQALQGNEVMGDFPYDLVLQFKALPRISLLLLFNERDEDFPASCTVLFPKHAERYLDPEALAMTSAYLASRLCNKAEANP